MLAHGALVQSALVAQPGGASAITMQAAPAAFTMTGRAAVFATSVASANAGYALAGNAAALTPTAIAGAGSYATAGVAASFAAALADGATYSLDTTDSGFTGGTYNRNLLRSGLTPGSLVASIPAATTQSLWCITPSGDPGTAGKRTGYSATLDVTAGNANVFGSVQFIRTDSIGAFQAQSIVTAEQVLNTGSVSFALAGVDLGTWNAADRLLLVLFLRNSAGTSQAVTIGLGSAASRASFGGTPYTLTARTFSVVESLAAGAGAFAVTGVDTRYSYDIDLGGLGSGVSGGTFSRGRWRKIQDDARAAREAAALARARIEDAAREAAQQRAAARRELIAAARAAEDAANAERARLRALQHALGAFAGAQRVSAQLQDAHALNQAAAATHAQRTAEREEEEAVVHLLLMA